MGSSFVQLHVHLVWSTLLRTPWLSAEYAKRVHGYVATRCRALRCDAIAVGGVADHIHVLAMLSPAISVAQLVNGIKAPTTTFIKRELGLFDFAWQSGYGAFSLAPRDLEAVRGYVINQERHHTNSEIVPSWEAVEVEGVG